VHPDPFALQLLFGGVAVLILAERGEEVDLGSELCEDAGNDPAAACGLGEHFARVNHIPAFWETGDRDKLDPLDMSDDREAHEDEILPG